MLSCALTPWYEYSRGLEHLERGVNAKKKAVSPPSRTLWGSDSLVTAPPLLRHWVHRLKHLPNFLESHSPAVSSFTGSPTHALSA